MKTQKPNTKIAIITWRDSSTADKWSLKSEIDTKPLECISVGFIVSETNETIAISGHKTKNKEPQYCGTMIIPKSTVAQIKKAII
jgi:hypothetical protein